MLVKHFGNSRKATEFFSCRIGGFSLTWRLWPGAEDKALRGRNLSAVFRTLYRQAGEPFQRLPSCAAAWRVENQCDKSSVRTASALGIDAEHPKRTSPEPRWQATCRSGSLSADIPRRANHRLAFE